MAWLSWSLLLVGLVAQAKDVRIPPLSRPVLDQVGILSSSQVQELNQLMFTRYQDSGIQGAIYIVNDLQGLTLEEFSIKVVDQWKLGSAKEDKGFLILLSPNIRRMRIEVGRGLEGEITDSFSKRTIDDVITPYFKSGNFYGGLTAGLDAVYAKALGTEPRPIRRIVHKAKNFDPFWIEVGVLLFFFIIASVLRGGRRRRFWDNDTWFGGGGGGWGGGGFGGGSSGGSYSGGGGHFNGGGASGGW